MYRKARKLARTRYAVEIKAYQNQQLQSILKLAKLHVPIHRKRFKETDSVHLRSIPPIDKSSMQYPLSATVDHDQLLKLGATPQELDQFCTSFYQQGAIWFRKHAMLAESTGTSGSKGLFFRTRKELMMRDAIRLAREGENPLQKLVTQWPIRKAIVMMRNPRYGTWQSARDASKRYARFVRVRLFSNLLDLDELIKDLN